MNSSLSRQVDLIWVTLIYGIVPTLAFALASRNLDSDDFTKFASVWALLNLIILVFFSPIEAKARFIYDETGRDRRAYFERLKAQVAQAWIFAATFGVIGIIILQPSLNNMSGIMLTIVFVTGLAFSNMLRIYLYAEGKSRSILKIAIVSSVLFLIMLQSAVWLGINQFSIYIMALPLSGIAATIIPAMSHWRELPIRSMQKKYRKIDLPSISLNFSYLLSLIPIAAPLTLLPFLKLTHNQVLALVGSITLIRSGMAIINTSGAWATFAYSATLHERSNLKRIFMLHMASFLLAGPICFIIFQIFNGWILKFYVGSDVEVDPALLGVVIASEVLIGATVTTRTLLFATNTNKSVISSWVVGLASYAVVYFLSASTLMGIFYGGIACGLTVMTYQGTAAFFHVKNEIN